MSYSIICLHSLRMPMSNPLTQPSLSSNTRNRLSIFRIFISHPTYAPSATPHYIIHYTR